MNAGLMKAGLDVLYYSGMHTLLAPLTAGMGAIFTLHHVRPARERAFQPNRILEVTPDFLDAVIVSARARGFDVVSLDEVHRRLAGQDNTAPFVCFTLDDGYRDNLDYAYPIFKKHNVPFAIYVAPSFCDGQGELWWLALERVMAAADHVEMDIGGECFSLDTGSDAARQAAFAKVYWPLRRAGEYEQRAAIRDLCARHGVDLAALCRELVMTWDDVRALVRDPLVTIGAHTMDHFAIAKLGADEALSQMCSSADIIAEQLGKRPDHFSFPYGDPSSAGARDFTLAARCGFKTAVTTRKGVIFEGHVSHLTALPRISLNGDYQSLRHVDVFLSGAPFLLWNGFRRLNVA